MSEELERRDARSAAIVKAIPMPRELQELGVIIGADEASGTRIVYLPDELRKRVNVVNPATSYVQADPNWTPGVSVVKIDVERDTYPLPGGKKGLSKQALETLAKAAGVLYTRTARVPREELQEGELWAYRATVGFRRSDGTVDELTRERGFNAEAERAEIEDSVAKAGQKFPTDEARAAETRKRWIAELRFGPAKTESKAINRALRAGLSIPTSVSSSDAAKPWLVIGYNFTPDYDDPEVKRALVAIGMNAQAAIYGGRELSTDLPEIPAGDIPAEAVTPRGGEEDVDRAGREPDTADRGAAPGSASEVDAEQAGDGRREPVAGSSDEPDLEPDLEPTPTPAMRVPEKAITDAAAVLARGETTVGEVLERAAGGDEKARTWLLWAWRTLGQDADDGRLAALRLVAEQRHPEVFADLEAMIQADQEGEGDHDE